MDDRVTYEEDVFLWSQQQAEALRRLAETRSDLPNDLDLRNIAEEIEDVGRSELNAVASRITRMFVHLVKLATLSGDAPPANHWRSEIRLFAAEAQLRYTPGMRQRLDIERYWAIAVRQAVASLRDHGDPVPELPAKCPFEPEEILSADPDVDVLVARLATSATGGA